MKKTWNSPEVQELTIQATEDWYDSCSYGVGYTKKNNCSSNGNGKGHDESKGKGHTSHGNGNGYGHIKHGCDCGDCES